MHEIEAQGARIPALGFGTGGLRGARGVATIAEAFIAGYRHFDTAASYATEAEVGEAMRAVGARRDEVFLTTKVWLDHLRRDDMLRSAEASARALGVDQADLLLIHWPHARMPLRESIEALNAARRAGLARHIGVSNFPAGLFEQAAALSEAPLVANQCEYHVRLDQRRLADACRRRGAALIAYMPLGRGALVTLPEPAEIAMRHQRTPAQIALRWLVQQDGVGAVVKSTDPARMRANLDIFDFSLPQADMARLSALARPDGRLSIFPRIRRNGDDFEDFAEHAPDWDA